MKKLCPDAVILPSDYETYSLFSVRMFEILRRFSPDVEEYSIDEAFDAFPILRARRNQLAGTAHYHTRLSAHFGSTEGYDG